MAQYIYSRKTVTAYIKKVCDDYFEFDIAWKSRSRKFKTRYTRYNEYKYKISVKCLQNQ